MSDYKYEIQMIAEEIAEEKYGRDYHTLEDCQQHSIFLEAEESWSEKKANQAEQMADRLAGF